MVMEGRRELERPGLTVYKDLGSASGSGGIGRHTILRGWRRKAWGFKSPLPHQF
jgi:hypothetical protein